MAPRANTALRPVRGTLTALGHRRRRSPAGRSAVADALAVAGRAGADLGLRERFGICRRCKPHHRCTLGDPTLRHSGAFAFAS
jgi:hypothetical protein